MFVWVLLLCRLSVCRSVCLSLAPPPPHTPLSLSLSHSPLCECVSCVEFSRGQCAFNRLPGVSRGAIRCQLPGLDRVSRCTHGADDSEHFERTRHLAGVSMTFVRSCVHMPASANAATTPVSLCTCSNHIAIFASDGEPAEDTLPFLYVPFTRFGADDGDQVNYDVAELVRLCSTRLGKVFRVLNMI